MQTTLLVFFIILLTSCGGSSDNKSPQSGDNVDFSGTWAMTDVKQSWGDTSVNDCTGDDLVVTHKPTLLILAEHTYHCGSGFSLKEPATYVNINGSALSSNGVDMGTIGPNFVHVYYTYGSGDSKSEMVVNVDPLENGAYSYQYEITGYYQGTVFKNKVTAKLSRK